MKLKGHKNSLNVSVACFAVILACLIYGCATAKQGNCVDQALATAAVAERHGVDIRAVVGEVKGTPHVEIMGGGKTYSWDSHYRELKASQGVPDYFDGEVTFYSIDVFRDVARRYNPVTKFQLEIFQAVYDVK